MKPHTTEPELLTISMRENSKHLNAEKTNYLDEDRMELIYPCCNETIGFVNYLIANQRTDRCPKYKGLFKYNFNITKSQPE